MEAYRDQYAKLFNGGRNVVVLAVSADADTALASWARDLQTPVLLGSDVGNVVGRRYGAPRGSSRNLFVIDSAGRIAKRMTPFNELPRRRTTSSRPPSNGRFPRTDPASPVIDRALDAGLDEGSDSSPRGRALLVDLYDAAVVAAPGPITVDALRDLGVESDQRVWLFAFGKAAHPDGDGRGVEPRARRALDRRRRRGGARGAVVHSSGRHGPRRRPSPSGTPVARRGAVSASSPPACAARPRARAHQRRATSLIGAPLRGMLEADLVHLYELLLGSGIDIREMNAVRKRFARWGAGRSPSRSRPPARRHWSSATSRATTPPTSPPVPAPGSNRCTRSPFWSAPACTAASRRRCASTSSAWRAARSPRRRDPCIPPSRT